MRCRAPRRSETSGTWIVREVIVAFTKHPATPHWLHETIELGRDDDGVWLGMPIGARYRRGREPWIANEVPTVVCVPQDGWWCLFRNGEGHRFSHYVDICTPPVWDGDRVEMVDLDLDVVRTVDGRVSIVDRDEFEEHRVVLDYPEAWVAGAERAADEVATRVREASGAFGPSGTAWLRRLQDGSRVT